MSKVRPLTLPGQSKPIGRYSPATMASVGRSSAILCISGQVATSATGEIISPGDARGQAEIVFGRLLALIEAAGGTVRDLLAVTIFLRDRSYFEAVNGVRNAAFRDHAPASTLVIAELMEEGCLVEINGVALVPNGGSE